MAPIDHPRERLEPEVARQLAAFSHEAEVAGELHPQQLELIYRHKWFKIFIPERLGGLGLTLPEAVRLEEAISWADGSTGWVVTLCAGAGWFVGFVDKHIRDEFFAGDKLCVAGSGASGGTAEILEDGYLVKGLWPYASGALHATTFTANCVVCRNGRPVIKDDGSELVKPFVLTPGEVNIRRTWKAQGMIATGSHSFTVENVRVLEARQFIIDATRATLDDPVFRFPFLQLAEVTLAVNISGMTLCFLAVAALSEGNSNTPSGDRMLMLLLREQESAVNDVRSLFFGCLDQAWAELTTNGLVAEPTLYQISIISHTLVVQCRATVDAIYPLCSTSSKAPGGNLNRVWRNIHTSLMHALFGGRMERSEVT